MKKDYPLILAIDTATPCSTVALTRGTVTGGDVVASLSYSSSITHSRRLIGLVDSVFRETDTDWPSLGGIAIGLGPGSFTGLRIGMSTAKGFAATAQIALLGVATPDGLAHCCLTDKRICAVMDARKNQVYSAFYYKNTDGAVVREGEIRAIEPVQLAAEIREPTVMVGDGVIAYHEYWKKELGDMVEFAPNHLHRPSAAAIGLVAGEMLEMGDSLDVAAASPLYVRASDAELSLVRSKGTSSQ